MPDPQPRHDYYAFARCACKHLVYADDVIGEGCRFCDCSFHAPAGQAPTSDKCPSDMSHRTPAPPVTSGEAG